MMHATVRAINLPDIILKICDRFQMTENEALHAFYTSVTGACFSDDDTGLYGQSAWYVFGMFCEEMGKPLTTE